MISRRLVCILAGLLVASSSTFRGAQMTPKEDCEKLMGELLPFAEQMLTKHREFYPFGGTMSADGQIAHAASYTGTEHPNSQELIDLLEKRFQEGARKHLYKATAIVLDIRTIPPGKSEKQDAVEVRLDHAGGYSVRVIFPYTLSADGHLTLEDPFAVRGADKIFAR